MENDKFQKGIENLKSIKLSSAEKDAMFKKLSGYADFHQKTSTKSFHYSNYSWFAFVRQGGAMAMMAFLVFGGAVVFASNSSIPGDILYPIKVNVEEPMRNAVNFSQASKIDWESEKADRRLEEAEILTEKGYLNVEVREEIEARFEAHTKKFNSLVEDKPEKVEKEEILEKKEKARTKFEENISKRTEKLDKIKEKLSSDNEKQEIENFKNSVLETVRKNRNDRTNED
jgi:uncharacterized membrane protein